MDIQQLIEIDKSLLLTLNGFHSLFLDGFMWTVTSTLIWIPAILVLLFVIFKNNKTYDSLFILLMIGLTILFADQFASSFCKPFFCRLRPAQDPDIMSLVHVVNGYRGGMYGFISSHAANTFGVAVFVSLLIRKWGVSLLMISWAFVPSYSRIYLGVHYPGDILFGALAGIIIAVINYSIYLFVKNKMMKGHTVRYASSSYSNSYGPSDLKLLYLILILTYIFAVINGMIISKLLHF